ncbi:MAG: Rpn family recombination-promoting nuclease/putative transposase [Lachnospiraceae bacterium]|nr:Rpn family recombination-promoting nuclease/putative transposase [Lachnospiraceae bacterium]MCD8010786.1 Rpn family recombination-promoting nuclease/putative transposase [Lachnospiraceae bacterium]
MSNSLKKWEDLELKDDFMFAKVMRDPELCQEMLERLLGFKITGIRYLEEQKTIDISYDSRSIRLDVYVEDDRQTVYNVEIQTTSSPELAKRSRYYQGLIDLNLIEKGEPYSKLNTSYVIFICTFDLFGQGRYQYTFENLCRENPKLRLNDQTVKIFFNTSGTIGDLSEEAKAFLRYVGGIPSEDDYVKRLQERISKVHNNQEWRQEYMTLLMRDQENRELGRQEGLKEGCKEGLKEGRKEGRKAGRKEGHQEGIRDEKKRVTVFLLQKGIYSDQDILSVAEISPEELQEIKESIRSK